MIRSTCSNIAALVAAMFLLAPLALAQVTTGNVTGRVVDSTGGVIPGANVVLVSEVHGNRIAPVKTNKEGDYTFADITADTYTIEVTAPAFKTARVKGIQVTRRRSRRRPAHHARGWRNHRNGFRNRRSDAGTDPER